MNKEKWMRSLKVGDTVCDCRYLHVKIAEIRNIHHVVVPKFLMKLLRWVPDRWWSQCHDWFYDHFSRVELVDRQLIFENGYSCSAKNCCDPVDHGGDTHLCRPAETKG